MSDGSVRDVTTDARLSWSSNDNKIAAIDNKQRVGYQSARNLERSQVVNLAQGEWLRRGQNLLITGPCGCGKTYLACALGYQACQQGHSTRYYRLPRLLLELSQAKVDGSYARLLGQLARIELLILND